MSWKPGQSGNPSGRKRSNWRKDFDAAIKADTEKHGQSIFELAIEQARTDSTLMAAILRKCLPDMKSIEAKIDGDMPIQLLVAVPGQNRAAELTDGGSLALPPVIPAASETVHKQASKHPATSKPKRKKTTRK